MDEIQTFDANCAGGNGSISFNGPFGGTSPYTITISKKSSDDGIVPCDDKRTEFTFQITNTGSFSGGIMLQCTPSKKLPYIPAFIDNLSTYADIAAYINYLIDQIQNVINPNFIINGFEPIWWRVDYTTGVVTLSIDKLYFGCCIELITTGTITTVIDANTGGVSCCPALLTPSLTGVPTYSQIATLAPFSVGSVSYPLNAGSYLAKIKDANGVEDSYYFIIGEPDATNGTALIKNVSCNNGKDGEIRLQSAFNNAKVSFKWIKVGDASFSSTEKNLIGITAGTYCVTINSITTCEETFCYHINQPTVLDFALLLDTEECDNEEAIITVGNLIGGTNTCTSCDISGYEVRVNDGEWIPIDGSNEYEIGAIKVGDRIKVSVRDCKCCIVTKKFKYEKQGVTIK